MKLPSIITSLFLIFLFLTPQSTSAKVLDECQLKPFKKLSAKEVDTDLEFRLAVETARNQYHNYVNCVFNKATDNLLKSSGGNIKNINKPKEACLSDKNAQKLKKILADSSPAYLLTPIMQAYQDYSTYLNDMQALWIENVSLNNSIDGVEQKQALKRMVKNEVQQSLIALDTAFIGLKEMRQAFVIHQHFQCMIKNLETYRIILGKLKSIVSSLPDLFHNASTSQ